MAKELRPYDPDARCPKCGHPWVTTEYCKAPNVEECSLGISSRVEHFHRKCERCSFEFAQAPNQEVDREQDA